MASTPREGQEGAFSQAGAASEGPGTPSREGVQAEPEQAIEATAPIARPGRLSARELMARKKVPPRIVLDGKLRVPLGTYLLAGSPKAGKSWLAMAQSLVLSGWLDEVLGMRAVAPADGIYILTDDATVDRVQDRFELLRSDGHGPANPPAEWDVFTSWPEEGSQYDGMSRIDALDAYLTDHPECRHVTIDTLVSWRESERENAVVQQEYTEVRNLQEVARRHGVLLIVVHYVNKGGSAKNFDWDDAFTSIAGTTALQGGADGMMVLHRVATHDGNQHGALWFRCRDLEEQEAAAELSKPSGRWVWLAAGADAVRTMDVRRAVIEYLLPLPAEAYHESKVILDGIAANVDVVPKHDTFRRTLTRMMHEGLLAGKRGSPGGGFRLHPAHRAELVAKRRF